MINGINLNDPAQNQITFQPSINTVSEFKVDNSTFSAEYGRNSGAIVNIATRSGTNEFHGEAFEFFRDDSLDSRNFFNPRAGAEVAVQAQPVRRQPRRADRQEQDVLLRQLRRPAPAPGHRHQQRRADATTQRAGGDRSRVAEPAAADPDRQRDRRQRRGRFSASATAPVNIDQFTGDVRHNLGNNDALHGYYAFQRDQRGEPTLQLNTIPGFGDTRHSHRQIMTLNETHIFGPTLVNEARFGFNRINITFEPNAQLNPVDYGINDRRDHADRRSRRSPSSASA